MVAAHARLGRPGAGGVNDPGCLGCLLAEWIGRHGWRYGASLLALLALQYTPQVR